MKTLLTVLLASATLAFGAAPGAQAQSAAVMDVPLNKSQTLRIPRPFAKAIIGNPEIADVLPTSVSSVWVMGKKIGTTNLTILDKQGGLVAVIDVVVGPDAMGLKHKLAELIPGETVGVSVSNDSIVLDGKATSAAIAERIATVAETFAPKRVVNLMSVGEPQQVLLEVRFSEMSRQTVNQLGIDNFQFGIQQILGQHLGDPAAYTSNINGRSIVPSINTASNPYTSTFGVNGISAQVSALEQKGLIHTLAQPNLVALSGESASFLAGGEYPVPTGIDQFGRIIIEFKQFGVSLAFVPTVVADGLINLSIAPEVSSIDPTISVQLQGVVIPGLKVRRAKTQIELRDGQAFAMAGLISSDFQDTIKAVPGLGKIPLFGAIFRSSYSNRDEKELVIMVTPHIVKPVRPAQILLPTDRVLQPSDADILFNGISERKAPITLPAGSPKPGGLDADYGHVLK